MPIRINGINIAEEQFIEKLRSYHFEDQTTFNFSHEEIYVCKLLNENGLNLSHLKPSCIFDLDFKCIRNVLTIYDNKFKYFSKDTELIAETSNVLIVPLWNELRNWLTEKGYKMDFHYDPFFKDEKIKMGFMKPKALTGTDNILIEADGMTDLEVLYKVALEVLKYEKSNPSVPQPPSNN